MRPSDRAAAALIDDARSALPQAGWEVRSRANASPQLERNISRFTQFLRLVGLAALLVGGVGVANAVKSHVDRRVDVIAAFKALGATSRDVFAIYLAQVMLLAGIGSVIGLAAGAALPFLIVGLFGKLLPLPVDAGAASGRTRARLRLRPSHRAGVRRSGRSAASMTCRCQRCSARPSIAEWHRPRWRYLALMAVVIALLIAVVIGLSYDKPSRRCSSPPRWWCSRCCAASPPR